MTADPAPITTDAAPARCTHACRNPLHCVLPPYILDFVAFKGRNDIQRSAALFTLQLDSSLRAARIGNLEMRRSERAGLRSARRAHRMAAPLAAAAAAQKQRTIYDAGHTQRLPGVLARREGQGPTGDLAVDEAYDWLGATWDMYWQVYDRNSLNGAGMPLVGTVHFDRDYDNAFWDGRQMVFGDGDGEVFERFTKPMDVVGHELTHGVIEEEAGLIYWGEPGALNESLADVFGALVKQYYLQQTADKADWLIGEGIFIPGAVKGVALRSMKAPGTAYGYPDPDPVLGTDPQPGHMKNFVRTLEDNGGVHINSGIPNHAFYLVATKLGGNAWERAGLIWYTTLVNAMLRPTANFSQFARLTVLSARRLYGAGSPEVQAVREGWSEVGITI